MSQLSLLLHFCIIPCFLNHNDFQCEIRVSYRAVKNLSQTNYLLQIFRTVHNNLLATISKVIYVLKESDRTDPFDSKLAFNY